MMSLMNRQARVKKQIERELLAIISAVCSPSIGSTIRIARVSITRDLSNVKVFVSFLLSSDHSALLTKINEEKYLIRKELAKRISIKKVPDLVFYLDDMTYAVRHTQNIINEIDDLGLEDEDSS